MLAIKRITGTYGLVPTCYSIRRREHTKIYKYIYFVAFMVVKLWSLQC